MNARAAHVRARILGALSIAKQFVAASIGTFDKRDLLLFAGLGLASYGLAPVYLPAAFIVPGAVLTAVAIFGVR